MGGSVLGGAMGDSVASNISGMGANLFGGQDASNTAQTDFMNNTIAPAWNQPSPAANTAAPISGMPAGQMDSGGGKSAALANGIGGMNMGGKSGAAPQGQPMQQMGGGMPQAQPFGGAQSMPAMYGQGGQLNLASMAPGSPIGQMAQHMGGQSTGLTGPGGMTPPQPFAANGGQFASNGQMQHARINPNMQHTPQTMPQTMPHPSLTVAPGFTGASTLQPPGFTGGLRKAPMGYRPPGRF
jgi:hypothetical protein